MPDVAPPPGPLAGSSLEFLLSHLNVGVFRSTPAGELLEASPAFLRLLGFGSLEQAQACNTVELYARPDERATAITRLIEDGAVNDQVLQLRRRDGSLLWVSVVEMAHRMADGRVVFDGILLETGERVAAAQELKASAERYERLLEQANVPIFLADAASGRLIHANQRAQELIGRSLEEIRLMHHLELHPESESARYAEIFGQHAGSPTTIPMEAEVVDREGTRIPVQISASLVDLGGRAAVQGVFHDLRGLRQAHRALEESAHRYRQLVELSPDAIVVHCRGQVVFANPTAARLLGGRGPDELVGRSVFDCVHPDDIGVVQARIRGMLESGDAAQMLEERFLRLDGSTIDVEVTAGPFTYLGEPAIQVVFRDIGERKHLHEELQRSQAEQTAILAALPVAVYAAEVPSHLDAVWMSSSVERFTGFSAERFMREPDFWSDRLHPDDAAGTMARFRAEVAAGEARVEYRWRVADGTYRWFSDHAVRVARRESVIHVIGVIADITERKQAEQALRDSEEKYRELVEKISEAIFVLDVDGVLTYISPAIVRILDLTPSEVIGGHFAAYIHPEDLPDLEASFGRTLSGDLHPSEFRVRTRNGSFRWVRSTSQPIIENDRPAGLRGVLVDIHSRREAEMALQRYARRVETIHDIDLAILAARSTQQIAAAALQRLRQLIPAERAAILAFHPVSGEGEYVAVESVPELAEPAGGTTHLGLFLPGELERNQTLYLSDLRSYPGHSVVLDRLRAQGVRTLLISSFVIDESLVAQLALSSRQLDAFSAQDQEVAGEVAGVLGVVLHQARLRERLEEQQRTLALLIGQLPDGLALLDHDHRLALANPVAVDYLALLGHDDLRAPVVHLAGFPLDQFLSPRETGLPFELHSGGTKPRVFELRVRPIAGGADHACILLLHDATREQQLARSIEQQDRLAVIGQLAGGLAHDFNNLLTAILTHAELLLRDPEQRSGAREALRIIKEQTERAAKLVRSILDFSRGSTSERVPLDLGSFVAEIGQILARTIPERIAIEVDVGTAGPCLVCVDPTQMQQVIMNVAVNARDAIPAQGVFRLQVRPLDLKEGEPPPLPDMPPGAWMHVSLYDTGGGIRPEHLSHVFEPFFTTKPQGHGTGLGLSQVYGLVKQNDGFVTAESRWGEGTTLHVFLPEYLGSATGPGAVEDELASGHGEVILLAEDETEVRLAIAQALTLLGYRVAAVENGRLALAHLEGGAAVDLLLTDLTMPVMGGEELIRATRPVFPQLRIVVLTGYAAARLEFLQELGVMAAVQKPLSIAALGKVVRDALSSDTPVAE